MHSTLVLPTWSIVVVSNLTVGVDGGIVLTDGVFHEDVKHSTRLKHIHKPFLA
jgi:hypothetical protein